MGAAVVLFVALVVLVVGCFLGWHANRAYFANGDVKTMHGRISGYRRTRLRSGLIAAGIALAVLLIASTLLRH
jgi:divalent metal cation (Fe/Co/Zn/Cd) transporter